MKPNTLKTICDIIKQHHRHNRLTIKYEVIKNGQVIRIGGGDFGLVCKDLPQLYSSLVEEYSNPIKIIACELQRQERIRSRANIRIEGLECSLAEALGKKH